MPGTADGANQAAQPAPLAMGGIADVLTNLESPKTPEGDTAQKKDYEAPQGMSDINDILSRAQNESESDDDEEAGSVATPAATGENPASKSAEDTAGQNSKEHQPGEEGGAGDEEIVSNFTQLVEQMGWDPEWAKNLTLTQTVDGETRDVSIGELLATHQTQEAATKRLDDAKAKAREIHAGLDAERRKVATEAAGAATLAQMAEKLFGMEAKRAELAKLKTSDQVGYLALKDEIEEQEQAIADVRGYASKAMKELFGELGKDRTAMTEDEKNAKATEERQKLFKAIPDWAGEKNHQKALKESTDLVEYGVKQYGFEPGDIVDNLDHRNLLILRKAFLYDRQQGEAEAAKKRVLKIPTVTKPGAKDQKPAVPANRTPVQILYRNK